MAWQPITADDLSLLINEQLLACTDEQRAYFQGSRVPFFEVGIERFGEIEKVFGVARVGERVVYYDDMEKGFEVAALDEKGAIKEQGMNHYTLATLLEILMTAPR